MKQQMMGVAVASAGPYAPDRWPRQYLNTHFLPRDAATCMLSRSWES